MACERGGRKQRGSARCHDECENDTSHLVVSLSFLGLLREEKNTDPDSSQVFSVKPPLS